jgi:hypothetical protein
MRQCLLLFKLGLCNLLLLALQNLSDLLWSQKHWLLNFCQINFLFARHHLDNRRLVKVCIARHCFRQLLCSPSLLQLQIFLMEPHMELPDFSLKIGVNRVFGLFTHVGFSFLPIFRYKNVIFSHWLHFLVSFLISLLQKVLVAREDRNCVIECDYLLRKVTILLTGLA